MPSPPANVAGIWKFAGRPDVARPATISPRGPGAGGAASTGEFRILFSANVPPQTANPPQTPQSCRPALPIVAGYPKFGFPDIPTSGRNRGPPGRPEIGRSPGRWAPKRSAPDGPQRPPDSGRIFRPGLPTKRPRLTPRNAEPGLSRSAHATCARYPGSEAPNPPILEVSLNPNIGPESAHVSVDRPRDMDPNAPG